jgi:hypothetical protein
MSVDQIRDLYMDLGGKIFDKKNNWWNPLETARFLRAGYSHTTLEKCLKAAFGDVTLGSDKIQTGLVYRGQAGRYKQHLAAHQSPRRCFLRLSDGSQ